MFIALLLVRPCLAAMGGIAVVTPLVSEIVTVIDAARALVILDRTLVLPTRRAIDSAQAALLVASVVRFNDHDAFSCFQFGRLNGVLIITQAVDGSLVLAHLTTSHPRRSHSIS